MGRVEAERYTLLEQKSSPIFTARREGFRASGLAGFARVWRITPAFSANRAVRQYTEEHYIPAASAYAARAAKDGTAAVNLLSWRQRIRERWGDVRFGALKTQSHRGELSLEVEVYLAGLDPSDVRVEVYADSQGSAPFRQEMAQASQGPANSARHLYSAMISTDRPESDFTPRVIPHHKMATRLEIDRIVWQR